MASICATFVLLRTYYIAVCYKLKLWEVRVNLRVHKSVSRIGLISSDYYTTSIFSYVGWGFAPDPTGELTALASPSGQIVGERGERRSHSVFGGGRPFP